MVLLRRRFFFKAKRQRGFQMIGTAVSFSKKALNPFLHFSRSRNALAEILIHPSGNAAYPRIRSLLPKAMQHLLRHDGLSFQNKNLLSCPHFQIGYCRRFFDLSETKNNPENRVLSDFRGHSSLFYSIFYGFLCPFCEIFGCTGSYGVIPTQSLPAVCWLYRRRSG